MALRLEQRIEKTEQTETTWQTSLENVIDACILSDDQKDFLREKMAGIYNNKNYSVEIQARTDLADRLIRDFRTNGSSPLLSALVTYIENYESERVSGELYSLLDVTRDVYDGLNEECQRLTFQDEVVMMYASTLSKREVGTSGDRSFVSLLLERLNGYDFNRLHDVDKENIIDSLNAAIDNLPLRDDDMPPELTLRDMEDCLAIANKVFPGGRFVIPEATIASFKKSSAVLGENDPAIISQTIDRFVADAKDSLGRFGDVPEKAIPALQLHFFNDLQFKDSDEGQKGMGSEERKKLENFIIAERFAEGNPYLPTIGVEIEVPHKLKVNQDFFDATIDLGVPCGYNEAWEFAVDYTYSSEMQSLLVKELIRGGFIETEESKKGKSIAGKGDFSLHVNLGIPLNLLDDFAQDEKRQEVFKKHADALVNAFTYAFNSPDRMLKRKTHVRFRANEIAKISKKNLNNDENSSSYTQIRENGKELWYGRLEIRSLELRDATFYRLMPEAQLLAAALFSACSQPIDTTISKSLLDIWTSFERDALAILTRYNLTLESMDIDYERTDIAVLLADTPLQKEFRDLISEAAMRIKRLIKPT